MYEKMLGSNTLLRMFQLTCMLGSDNSKGLKEIIIGFGLELRCLRNKL